MELEDRFGAEASASGDYESQISCQSPDSGGELMTETRESVQILFKLFYRNEEVSFCPDT